MTNWTSSIDVPIVLTIDIFRELEFHVYVHKIVYICVSLHIFVYICVYCVYIVVTSDVAFDLSRVNKFIINHHETSTNMLHTRYIASFATR